ncbi:MAG: hypothetical protein IJ899_16810 [Blautia sp.]|nr:hypothetical protein [Blautia sp.]
MPISQKDKEFMEQVAMYFRNTKTSKDPNGSIRDTAMKFHINRNKVRKILVTVGEIKSSITETVLLMRRQGMSVKEIADNLGLSVATISTAIPYEDKIDNTLEPTKHASDVREYRAYEKKQLKRQVGRTLKMQAEPSVRKGDRMTDQETKEKEWQKDIKMSYTETSYRPHRNTWEDLDKIREILAGKMTEDAPEELKELFAALESMKESHEDEDKEFEILLKKKKLSEKEKDRLQVLMFLTGQFPGALNDRNRKALEQISGNRLPPEPMEVLRLHLELYDEYSDGVIENEDAKVFRTYGKVEFGNSISRDIIVPADIPLYALHYVIQRVFGWQNSHLRKFELPEDRFQIVTNGKTSMWSRMVGVLFRSPFMGEDDEFWADDYNGGSFKNWMRKKYTGPYQSQCQGEGIFSCRQDMMKLDMNADYYVMYSRAYNRRTQKYDGEEYVLAVSPVHGTNGEKRPEPRPWQGDDIPYRIEIVRFSEVPSEGLRRFFERNPETLLERLPINTVLAAGKFSLPENCTEEERKYIDEQMAESGDEVYQQSEEYITRIISEQIDSPDMQVLPIPVTDVLLYTYDFGDNWKIRITASENCTDLVESGRITQTGLDRANVKCREVYRPVLIARDGEMLVDDVGGIHGFADFLEKINPELKGMDPEEKEDARREKKEYLEWAKSLGWHREKISDFSLL